MMHVHQFDLIWRLVLALVLSSAIGVEREMRQKSAGLRTNALVGTGSALFILISEYGFASVLGPHVTLDPSRVAAGVVSGIGFIGGGLIFVRRTDVRGLTTAAGVWVTAAVGMAAGGDLPVLAVFTTLIYMVISYGFPLLERRLPQSRDVPSELTLCYIDGKGILRQLLAECAEHGFLVADVAVEHDTAGAVEHDEPTVTLRLKLRGRGSVPELAGDVAAVDGVLSVHAGDPPIRPASGDFE
jgi:putative Mg2+ transporter-C (MgtC) family protein